MLNPKITWRIFEGQKISFVRKCKFLGVVIDQELTWSAQIMAASNKISKIIGMLSKARKILNRKGLITIYNA